MTRRGTPKTAPALALLLAAATIPMAAGAQDLVEAYRADLALLDRDGKAVSRPAANTPLRLRLTLADGATGAAPRGLHLAAFLRPAAAGKADCAETARIYRATRRTARGDVDLNGLLIASLGRDGRIALADPRLDLATSNLTRIVSFPEAPAAIAAEPATMAMLASLPAAGEVVRILLPSGERQVLTSGLGRPGALAVARDGSIVVHEEARQRLAVLAPSGEPRTHIALDGPARLEVATDGHILALGESGAALVLDSDDARETGRATLPAGPKAFSPLAHALLTAAPDRAALTRIFLDAPEQPAEIAIAAPAASLHASAGGRFIFALGEGGRALSIVDMQSEMLVQAAGFDEPVIAIAFAGEAAFLQFAGRSAVGVVTIDSIRAGKGLAVRRVDLGRAPEGVVQSEDALIASLAPIPGVLAAGPDPRGLYLIFAEAGHANAPQTALRLRSDVPRRVAALDRSFRETAPGRYETAALLPHGGAWMLVVNAGAGSFTRCFAFEAEGPAPAGAQAEPPRLVLDRERSRIRARTPSELVFRLAGSEAPPRRLIAASLTSHWRGTGTVRQREDGLFAAELSFPAPGQYPVILDGGSGAEPMIVEVSE
ncbi:hypothetical protein [Bosea vestrisii]|uniref:Lactonase family protein with 7-bladed beta-propeller n=1 Tax=Bosea vestrisii TaxID=151416 RepID=A0ABW0HD45_9HYPH